MIPHYKGSVPFITADQMREIDRVAETDFNISLIQMIENAGQNLATVAREIFLDNDPEGKKVLVIAGSGGNGGGALVAARRLSNLGADVEILLSSAKSSFKKETISQFMTLQKMGVKIVEEIDEPDLIIDGMIGYGIQDNIKPKVKSLITQINESNCKVLSLDAPSGLNLNTGKPSNPTIKADATMTVALSKLGLFKIESSRLVGDLYLADIGLPPKIFTPINGENIQIQKIFRQGSVVKINKMVVFS